MPEIVVDFQVKCQTEPGEDVRIVGTSFRLGDWSPERGIRLTTNSSTYPLWRADSIVLPAHEALEYKYVVVRAASGEVQWEDCANRPVPTISPTGHGQDIVTIEDFFGDDRVQHISIQTVAMKTNPESIERVAQNPQEFSQPEVNAQPFSGIHKEEMKPLKQVGSSIFFDTLPDDEDEPDAPYAHTEVNGTSPKFGVPTCSSVEWLNKGVGNHSGAATESTRTISGNNSEKGSSRSEEDLMVTWPHNAGTMSVHVLGSFTQPPWQQRIDMSLCRVSGVWWVSLVEACPGILDRACDHEFKFLVNGSSWCVHQEMKRRTSADGNENNLLCVTQDLVYQNEHVDLEVPPNFAGMPRLKSGACLIDSLMSLNADAVYKPKDTSKDGEDAFFIGAPVLGIADGVGGLEKYLGHSSRAFAEQLMNACEAEVDAHIQWAQVQNQMSPPSKSAMEIFRKGYTKVTCHGASTALVAYLDSNQHRLGVASLGDSGLMVLRRCQAKLGDKPADFSIIFKTPAQQHAFNFPFQLCRVSNQLRAQFVQEPDSPESAATFDIEVEQGDLILVYTDGLDDNLTDDEILQHLNGLSPKILDSPKSIAQALVAAAYERSHDDEAITPFAQQARLAGYPGPQCRGGKQDDITCIAAWVTQESD